MADIGMGKLVEHDEVVMDAVHVAVITMTANGKLYPGDHVGFVDGGGKEHVGRKTNKFIGIVDPFLQNPVHDGQRFWLFLFPNTTTPMRHSWSHPDIAAAAIAPVNDKAKAEKWLREFAERANVTYKQAIDSGHNTNQTGDYFTQIDEETARSEMYKPGVRVEFWRNWSIVTGETVNDPEHSVFSCSC